MQSCQILFNWRCGVTDESSTALPRQPPIAAVNWVHFVSLGEVLLSDTVSFSEMIFLLGTQVLGSLTVLSQMLPLLGSFHSWGWLFIHCFPHMSRQLNATSCPSSAWTFRVCVWIWTSYQCALMPLRETTSSSLALMVNITFEAHSTSCLELFSLNSCFSNGTQCFAAELSFIFCIAISLFLLIQKLENSSRLKSEGNAAHIHEETWKLQNHNWGIYYYYYFWIKKAVKFQDVEIGKHYYRIREMYTRKDAVLLKAQCKRLRAVMALKNSVKLLQCNEIWRYVIKNYMILMVDKDF